jgi:predicted small lipoprotein YifL
MRDLVVIIALITLSGCIQSPPPAPPAKEKNTEMRDAIQAPIDKANQVEDQVLDDAEKKRAEIEAAGG